MANQKRVVLAADHAGYPLKEEIKTFLTGKGIDVIDVGTFSEAQDDYPPIMRRGCAVVLEQGTPGIFFGGSGNGEAMAANKVRGIRAAVCYNAKITKLARQHNDANVMCMGARFTDLSAAKEMVDVFLSTDFEGGRHTARVADLDTPIAS